MSRKPFKKEEKLAAIELWRASVPLAKIRSQLGMSKATLKRVLAFAKANPANPIKPRMPGSGKQQNGKIHFLRYPSQTKSFSPIALNFGGMMQF